MRPRSDRQISSKLRKRSKALSHAQARPIQWRAAGLRLFWGACLTVVLGTFAGSLSFMYHRLIRSGALDVREVEVRGAHRVGPELADYLQLRDKMPLSAVDTRLLSERLRRHSWIKNAVVKKSYPHKLIIELQERRPALLQQLRELLARRRAARDELAAFLNRW